jgi:hypothetical protein
VIFSDSSGKYSDITSENNQENIVIRVGFEVLTAVSMKIAVFWVVAPCSMVDVYLEVNFYQTTRCYNPEDSNLQSY